MTIKALIRSAGKIKTFMHSLTDTTSMPRVPTYTTRTSSPRIQHYVTIEVKTTTHDEYTTDKWQGNKKENK